MSEAMMKRYKDWNEAHKTLNIHRRRKVSYLSFVQNATKYEKQLKKAQEECDVTI